MTRALSLTCLVLLALVGLGSGEALAKPKIAVLGLEVLNPNGGALDPAATTAAKELTDQLRQRARTGSGTGTGRSCARSHCAGDDTCA